MPSIQNWMKRLLETQAEQFRGTVTAEETGSETTTFYVNDLAGYGDDYFNDEWWIQIVETTDGAAPEAEWRKVSDYVSNTGKFVVSAVFSANVNIGDNLIVMHEYQHGIGAQDDAALGTTVDDDGTQSLITLNRGVIDRIGNVDDAASADDLSDIATANMLAKVRRLLLRFSSNAFAATINGGSRADIETMFAETAKYFATNGAAISATVNPGGSARDNLELILEDVGQMLAGSTGIITYPAAANIGNGVSLAESIRAILTSLVGGDDYDGYTNINNTANTSLNAALQNLAAVLGADAANVFNPTIDGSARTDLDAALAALGTLVDNVYATQPRIVAKAAATLPQTAQSALFTVTGRVLITQIVGEVTVVIGAGANNTKLVANPTVGADVDLCAVLDTANDAVGTMYNITGTFANAMIATTSGAMKAQSDGIVVAAGTIDLNCAASNTGEVKWVVHYIPLDAGSTVT